MRMHMPPMLRFQLLGTARHGDGGSDRDPRAAHDPHARRRNWRADKVGQVVDDQQPVVKDPAEIVPMEVDAKQEMATQINASSAASPPPPVSERLQAQKEEILRMTEMNKFVKTVVGSAAGPSAAPIAPPPRPSSSCRAPSSSSASSSTSTSSSSSTRPRGRSPKRRTPHARRRRSPPSRDRVRPFRERRRRRLRLVAASA